MIVIITLFLISFFLSIVMTKIMIMIAWNRNILSHPNPIIKVHKKPVAYLGGAGIFLSFLLMMSYVSQNLKGDYSSMAYVFLGTGLFTLLGLLDDLKQFDNKLKFLFQLIATVIVVGLGFSMDLFGVRIIDGLISGFVLLFMLNAFNFLDVCDGLLTLVFVPISVFFALTFSQDLSHVCMVAILLGFFIYNRPDARVYLGDAGSHLLGFLSYVYAVQYYDQYGLLESAMTMGIVFSVILFEFFFLLYRRTKQGLSIFRGSPDHYSVLLTRAGWSKSKIIWVSFIITTVLIFLLLAQQYFYKNGLAVLFLIVLMFYFWLGYKLNKSQGLKM